MTWNITIGAYRLGMLDSVEINKSVDLLADTCTIIVPATIYNKALKIEYKEDFENLEEKIKGGDKVVVELGYNDNNIKEFEGYIQAIRTDDGSITLVCEDDLYLLRKAVADKQFKSATIKEIAQYLIDQTGISMKLNVTLSINYDKFIISKATAYDVLKKLQQETKGSIYIKKNSEGVSELNIHPPYIEKHGYVRYSFQKNIESSDLKYKRKSDRQIEVIVESTGKDGKKIESTAGQKGGDKIRLGAKGMNKPGMDVVAANEYNLKVYDGYEGSITGWLIPYCEPGMSAEIKDLEYEFKNGWYYVNSVTTTFSSSGGARKVQLGIKVGGSPVRVATVNVGELQDG